MEVRRLKMDNRKVMDDFKSANKELQRNWDMLQVRLATLLKAIFLL